MNGYTVIHATLHPFMASLKSDGQGRVLLSADAEKVKAEPDPVPPRPRCKNVCRCYFIGIDERNRIVHRCGTCLNRIYTNLVTAEVSEGQGSLF